MFAEIAATLLTTLAVAAQESPPPITHAFLATGTATYLRDGAGKVAWSYPHGSRDGWVLPSGNVLLALSGDKKNPGGSAVEVTKDGKVVFEFKGTQAEVNTVQLVGERIPSHRGRARIRDCSRSDRQGKIVSSRCRCRPADEAITHFTCRPAWP